MSEDSSKSKKTPAALRVRFRASSLEDFVRQQASNLSSGGIFIKSKSPLPRGTLMVFDFQLQDGSSLIKGVGRVVWARKPEAARNEPPGMGIKFIRVEPESMPNFKRLMAAKGEAEPQGDVVVRLGDAGTQTPVPVLSSVESPSEPSINADLEPEIEAVDSRTPSVVPDMPMASDDMTDTGNEPTSKFSRSVMQHFLTKPASPDGAAAAPQGPMGVRSGDDTSDESPGFGVGHGMDAGPVGGVRGPEGPELGRSYAAPDEDATLPDDETAGRAAAYRPAGGEAEAGVAHHVGPPTTKAREEQAKEGGKGLVLAVVVMSLLLVVAGGYLVYTFSSGRTGGGQDAPTLPESASVNLAPSEAPEDHQPSAEPASAEPAAQETTGSDASAEPTETATAAPSEVQDEGSGSAETSPAEDHSAPAEATTDQPPMKVVVINTTPPDVRVSINGEGVGRTPLRVTSKRIPLDRPLRVRLSRIGVENWDQLIEPSDPRWNASGELRIDVTMVERPSERSSGDRGTKRPQRGEQPPTEAGEDAPPAATPPASAPAPAPTVAPVVSPPPSSGGTGD